ncbi:MAG: hypothetical protein KDK91_05935 [Gammaproteobacteria bacterium]|nr:hypothetical protein [Gammaproteobacteria bacterium]
MLQRASPDRHDAESFVAEVAVLNERLLRAAAKAVQGGDQGRLAAILGLLGELAIEQQAFDVAELYLGEALGVYEAERDPLGVAEVNLQLGRMHVKLRERARVAAHAYDRLLLARWQRHHGHLESARRNLQRVIDENLSIRRHGAAAAAHLTLLEVTLQQGDLDGAANAAMEAVRLYAASGQMAEVRPLLAVLESIGVDSEHIEQLRQDSLRRSERFSLEMQHLARADDYDRLFNHYRARGDLVEAWRWRLKANESVRDLASRVMYRRSPDVLALLFASNRHMEQARHYLDLAGQRFALEGQTELLANTERLRARIY